MNNNDVIRAWKDRRFRRNLGFASSGSLPENPAGLVELTDDELKVAGGLAVDSNFPITTARTCTEYTFLRWKACGCGA
ncbi:MAG TPA: mersacidin/lichenicidin family type 2 lantibiotic [Blastocatellia bacterium]|nr:mersacidin/lichenicidin family type 2 lantibiotic [Blastocatellia bacterium]